MNGISPTTLKPDSVLHIYYLEGIVPKDIAIDHPGFLGNWEEDGFSFLFFQAPAPEVVAAMCKGSDHLSLLDSYEMTYADWQGGDVGPLEIGRFLFNPPWETADPDGGPLTVTLDAGVVFGNGAHPTTRDCIEAIEIACGGGKVSTMLDLGTGTGILALAAARLGCEKIVAIDFNLLACRTAATNVRLNDLRKNILVANGKAEELLARPTDLLVANIHYAVMKEIVKSEGFLRQKWFVLSGLLNSEAEKINEYLKSLPVLVLKKWRRDGIWNTFLGLTRESE